MTKVIFRISELITERGMTQKEFSCRAKISLSYLHQIEYGQKQPTIKILVRIADALDCAVKDLFYEVKE